MHDAGSVKFGAVSRSFVAIVAGCAAALLLLGLACTTGRGVEAAEKQEARGDLPGAEKALEAQQARNPDSVQVHLDLGELHYRRARAALDGDLRDEDAYLSQLEAALREFVAAARLDPSNYEVHFWLAMMDAYRGDIHGALRGFANAHHLEPNLLIAYTNIAEVYVYLGELEKARRWDEVATSHGVDPGPVHFNDMLIAWREGNLRVAHRQFARLKSVYPEELQTINAATLPREPQTFEEFAGYCCGSPACGPYMVDACKAVGAPVRRRQLSKEAALRELGIEMEQKRQLQRIYDKHKELDIQVEPDELGAPAGSGQPAQTKSPPDRP